MKDEKSPLNIEQKAAVEHGEGPLLIIAGAGTGKTTVITRRIAHLILDKKLETDRVLALTFTEKAAQEMEERVDQLLPYGYVDLWVSTFHSFCERVLRQHGLDIGLPTDFKIVSTTDQWLLVRQNLEEFQLDYYQPKGNPTKFIHALLSHFSKAKDEDIYPEAYMKYAKDIALKASKKSDEIELLEARRIAEVARAYSTYQQLLLDNNYLDFGDLINYTLTLFRDRPAIRERFSEQFAYILVDEFQDTNFAQYELIKMMTGKTGNLTVVGDDDQSIYKFRGASISNIMQFKKDYPKAKEVVLTENYRSCQPILDLAYNFIQLNNPNRLEVALSGSEKEAKKGINKRLQTKKSSECVVEHYQYESLEDEVAGTVDRIISLKRANTKLEWSDFAILVRANDSATHFTNYLKKTDIPYNFVALKGLYNKSIILDVIAYFQLLDNYHESPSVFRVLISDFMDMPHADVVELTHFSKQKGISLYEALKRISESRIRNPETPSKANKLLKMISCHSEKVQSASAGEIFLLFLQDSGILSRLLKEESLEDKLDLEYLQQFHKRIQEFEEASNDASLPLFLSELKLEMESGESGGLRPDMQLGPEAINIMTIHASKGLEFEYVFLPNMVDKRFPTLERREPIELPETLIKDILPVGDAHLQEERRLLYVAITRAKSGLFLTSAEDYGGLRKKKISRFLVELSETNPSFKLSDTQELELKVKPVKLKIDEGPEVVQYELPKRFSFSQLAAFQKCPYQYKLGFIYKIPTFGKHVFSYGRTMHSVLEQFYKLVAQRMSGGQITLFDAISNKNPGRTIRELISFDEITELLEANWIDEWYESPEQKKDYRDQAIASLTRLYEQVRDVEPRVHYLEKTFHLKLHDEETGETYQLRGVIDRVDQLPDGSWHIIDYKTGTAKDKLDWEQKMQLLIYQVAAEELFQAKVSKLTYYYLDNNAELSFVGTDKDKKKLKEELIKTIRAMKRSNFAATPGWQCTFCDFRSICEYKVM